MASKRDLLLVTLMSALLFAETLYLINSQQDGITKLTLNTIDVGKLQTKSVRDLGKKFVYLNIGSNQFLIDHKYVRYYNDDTLQIFLSGSASFTASLDEHNSLLNICRKPDHCYIGGEDFHKERKLQRIILYIFCGLFGLATLALSYRLVK